MNPTDSAAEALDAFATGPAADAADGLAQLFEQAGDRIADSLDRAAKSGEVSFNALADSIATDFARFAVDQLVTAPLEGLVSSLTSSLAGAVTAGSSPVTVNLSMPSGSTGSSATQASGAQIAARVAQAVTKAQTRTG